MSNIIHIEQPGKFSFKKITKKMSWKKISILIISIAVLIVAGGVTAWFVMSNQKTSNEKDSKNYPSKEVVKAAQDAQKLISSGKTDEASKLYDDEIANTSDPYQKARLLLSKAIMIYNKGEYDNALTVAKQAESYDSNESSAAFIAQIYTMKGDKQKAIEYYQKVISLMDKSQPTYESELQYYNDSIKELGGTE